MKFRGKDLKITLRERKYDLLWGFYIALLTVFVVINTGGFVVMILSDDGWFAWFDGLLSGIVGCILFIYFRDLHRCRNVAKMEKAVSAFQFALQEGRHALIGMRKGLKEENALLFFDASEDAQDAAEFGLRNYRNAQKLGTTTYKYTLQWTMPQDSSEELEEIEDLREQLYRKALADGLIEETTEQRQGVQAKDASSEQSTDGGVADFWPRSTVAERFQPAWERIRPGELDNWVKRSLDAHHVSKKEKEQATMLDVPGKSRYESKDDDKIQWND